MTGEWTRVLLEYTDTCDDCGEDVGTVMCNGYDIGDAETVLPAWIGDSRVVLELICDECHLEATRG